MPKLYVNGWDKFKVTTRKTGTLDKVYNFSFKYEAMKEYYEKISTLNRWDDGSKSKTPHYIDYEWRIFYISRIDNPDTLMFKDVENDEIDGRDIYLMPHIDIGVREIRALIKDELRELDLQPHFNGLDETSNRGFSITFMNAEPIKYVEMIDPNTYVPSYILGNVNPQKGVLVTT